MRLFRQLELQFTPQRRGSEPALERQPLVAGGALRLPSKTLASGALALQSANRRDHDLEQQARDLLRENGAGRMAGEIRVEWNPRLKSCAGRADYKARLISLNPLLRDHGAEEIDRTFRHELAHLLAQFRAGRRRILPHGQEWRRACHDLAIGDEKRCHNLPFPVKHRARRYLYRCPNCRRDFARSRRIHRAVACLACCRAHNEGQFDKRFRLRLVSCRGGL